RRHTRSTRDWSSDVCSSDLVLDAHLPEVSGFDMCRILKSRQETAAIPILMLSGVYREAVDKARGLEFGSDAYLTKPVTATELVRSEERRVGKGWGGRGGTSK